MVTIFCTPRTFQGHFGLIQRNAIRSWTRLTPTPQVLILGGDSDAADECRELGVTHVPDVACNEFGTPLANSMVALAGERADFPFLLWIAADNLILDDITPPLSVAAAKFDRFCIVGGRHHIRLDAPIDFADPRWRNRVRRRATSPRMNEMGAGDFFLFPKGFWGEMPPFTEGRFYLDTWLFGRTLQLGGALIDATAVMTTVHQDHGYTHYPGGLAAIASGIESTRNWELGGKEMQDFSREQANWVFTRRGLFPPRWTRRARIALHHAMERSPFACAWRYRFGRALDIVLRRDPEPVE